MAILSRRAQALAERRFEIDRRLLAIMEIVGAEWQSDPLSVQCFVSRIVREALDLLVERKSCPLPFDL